MYEVLEMLWNTLCVYFKKYFSQLCHIISPFQQKRFRHPQRPHFFWWWKYIVCMQVKSRFFKNRELYWSNLPQNSNCGRDLIQKFGVEIPIGEGKIFLSCFLFIFSIKNWILTNKILFFIFFYQLNINKNRYIEQILFYFYVTC